MESNDVGLSAVPQSDCFISTFVSLDLYSVGDINILFNKLANVCDELRVPGEGPFLLIDDGITDCLCVDR